MTLLKLITMELKEIKKTIEERLNKLTIDELFFEGNRGFSKLIFDEITGCKTDEDIEEYLAKETPKTTREMFRHEMIRREKELDLSFASNEKELNLCNQKLADMKAKDKNILDTWIAQSKTKEKFDAELIDIETELTKTNPLPETKITKEQILKYEDRKKEIANVLAANSIPDKTFNKERDALRSSEIATEKVGVQLRKIIKQIKVERENNVDEAKLFSKRDIPYFKEEYEALEFLYFILLGYEISVYEDMAKPSILKPELIKFKVDGDKVFKFKESCAINRICVPDAWRIILHDAIAPPSISFKGTLYRNSTKGVFVEMSEEKLSTSDYSFMLAMQLATKKNPSMTTGENKVIMPLSGGTIATLSFRERGATVPFDKTSFYINCLAENKRTTQKIMYYQSGNDDSTIKIDVPSGYYIVTEEYVIEIAFDAAPVFA